MANSCRGGIAFGALYWDRRDLDIEGVLLFAEGTEREGERARVAMNTRCLTETIICNYDEIKPG